MTEKKRTTRPLPKRSPAPSARAVSKEAVVLPVPAVSGPVKPPRVVPAWWIFPISAFFVFATVAAMFVTFVKPVQAPTEDPQTLATPVTPETHTYSYLSVVDAPPSTIDCSTLESAPQTSAPLSFILAVDFPNASSDQLTNMSQLVSLVEKHQIKLTIGLSGFVAEDTADNLLSIWSKAGHEISIAFDPTQTFKTPALDTVPYGTWLKEFHDMQDELKEACDCQVTSWVGGDGYKRLFDVAEDLKLTTHSGWMDPVTHLPPAPLQVVNPWSVASDESLASYLTFNPLGSIVAIPSGIYPTSCVQPTKDAPFFSAANLPFFTKSIYASLQAVNKEKMNVFRLSLTPGDIAWLDTHTEELQALDEWMTSTIDPLVKKNMLVPSTSAEVATQYSTWLDANLGKIDFVKK